jgi:hypothetical protein
VIGLIFYYAQEIIYIRIDGHNVHFSNSTFGAVETTIDGLKLNKSGVLKEHPDLKDRDDWKEQAVIRFKESINSLRNEDAIAEYIIMDLKKYGYVPKWKQKAGFRRTKIE